MRLIRILFFIALFLLTNSFILSEIKYGGYFSFDYIKSQKEGINPNGDILNSYFSLNFSGKFDSKFYFYSEVRTENALSDFFLEQAWVGFRGGAFFNLKLGAFLVPFGMLNQIHRPNQMRLINLPLSHENIIPVPWTDIGVSIDGKYGIVSYSVYLTNGLGEGKDISGGRQFRDNNKDKAKGGRLSVSLGKGLKIGFSQYKGKYNSENNLNLNLKGIDLIWSNAKTILLAEYSKADIENRIPYEKGKAEGYFIIFSFSIGNFSPVFSYQFLNYKDPFHGEGFIPGLKEGAGIDKKRERWTIGLNYYPVSNIAFKVEYQFNKEKDLQLKDNTLRIQVAVSF
ncbi:porin [SCandidatus Aminicenantes bacterium Aminicenantia_JdfR_composite]|jgi:opacity protein-like surface antigen|nr:porin [SCandidatus Aminicenantes bacterium Aminicenantia_JdfR_composite]MCP2596590.1 porin [Candidatus Aminicenantes bacterium AC-335-G13]MCP2598189.1 porin [Candidatus Aminicenantes bacterium AC-335-L06]